MECALWSKTCVTSIQRPSSLLSRTLCAQFTIAELSALISTVWQKRLSLSSHVYDMDCCQLSEIQRSTTSSSFEAQDMHLVMILANVRIVLQGHGMRHWRTLVFGLYGTDRTVSPNVSFFSWHARAIPSRFSRPCTSQRYPNERLILLLLTSDRRLFRGESNKLGCGAYASTRCSVNLAPTWVGRMFQSNGREDLHSCPDQVQKTGQNVNEVLSTWHGVYWGHVILSWSMQGLGKNCWLYSLYCVASPCY